MQTIIFDFDGVIHSYKSGWKGIDVLPDEPVEGIKEAIIQLKRKYKIVIFSSRCVKKEGIEAIRKWLKKHDFPWIEIVDKKVPAILSIDDRCICFDGSSCDLIERIEKFKVWDRK